ncbi:MAG: sugar phosphate isomerase/epimerase family protein [Bacilli bacterium]
MKKCFTINEFRSEEEILSYYYLLDNKLYEAIEIFYPYKATDTQKVIYERAISNLVNHFSNIEVVCHLPFGVNESLVIDSKCDNTVKLIKEALVFAHKFRVKTTVLHLGRVDSSNLERITKDVILKLKDLCCFAKRFDIKIAIENMPSNNELGYSPQEIKKIIDLVNQDNLGFIYDTGHGNVSEFSIDDYLDLLKDKLWHIHINDNNEIRDEHKRIGLGNIDFKYFFDKTYQINYNGLYCSEIIYNDVNDLIAFYHDFEKYS